MKYLITLLFNFFHRLKEPKEKEFCFETWQIHKIKEYRKYTVTAYTKEEAFQKLVEYHYGTKSNQPIYSDEGYSEEPYRVFGCIGMPYWFAKLLFGVQKEDDGYGKYNHKLSLENYAREQNIQLKA